MTFSTGSTLPDRAGSTAGTATLAVQLDDELLVGLHALATLDAVDQGDASGFAGVAARALREGVSAQLAAAGLPLAPTADEVEEAVRMEREAGILGGTVEARAPDGTADEPGALVALLGRPGDQPVRWAVVGVSLVALVVTVVGGYGAGWTWTGFQTNDQLWDWLNLLLLPVAFGTVPLWLQYRRQMANRHKSILLGGLVAFGLLAVAGYLEPLVWTGFPGQTLWNWLTLVVLPVSLTTMRLWPSSLREAKRVHLVAASSLLAGLVVTLVGGYVAGWAWTGFHGNTLWDWMQLLLAPIVINTVVVPAVIRIASGDVSARAEQLARAEQRRRLLEAARRRVGGTGGPAGSPQRA